MASRKVRAGHVYFYNPAKLDRIDGRINLKEGDQVRVVNLPGCPGANTLGHCHVENLAGEFIGLGQTASLDTREQYTEYLERRFVPHTFVPLS